jgi:hypothetical protein
MNLDTKTNHHAKHKSLHLPLTSVTCRLRKKHRRGENNSAMSDSGDDIRDEDGNEYAILIEKVISGLLWLTLFDG